MLIQQVYEEFLGYVFRLKGWNIKDKNSLNLEIQEIVSEHVYSGVDPLLLTQMYKDLLSTEISAIKNDTAPYVRPIVSRLEENIDKMKKETNWNDFEKKSKKKDSKSGVSKQEFDALLKGMINLPNNTNNKKK